MKTFHRDIVTRNNKNSSSSKRELTLCLKLSDRPMDAALFLLLKRDNILITTYVPQKEIEQHVHPNSALLYRYSNYQMSTSQQNAADAKTDLLQRQQHILTY